MTSTPAPSENRREALREVSRLLRSFSSIHPVAIAAAADQLSAVARDGDDLAVDAAALVAESLAELAVDPTPAARGSMEIRMRVLRLMATRPPG